LAVRRPYGTLLPHSWSAEILVSHFPLTCSANSYAAVADLIHHLRNDITIAQVARMANIFSNLLLNPNLAGPMHVSCAKMVFNLIDVIATKDTPQNAARIINAIFETSLDKLDAMVIIQDELSNRWERLKRGEKDTIDVTTIEKSRPVASAHYAITKPEETIHGKDV
jgi:transformation/transcription domain-associated protein